MTTEREELRKVVGENARAIETKLLDLFIAHAEDLSAAGVDQREIADAMFRVACAHYLKLMRAHEVAAVLTLVAKDLITPRGRPN